MPALTDILFGPAPIVWVQRTLGLGWPAPFRAISLLGISWGVVLILGLALWLWGRKDAYALGAALLVEATSNLVINRLGGVPRPSAPEIIVYQQIELPSFPSGHIYTATVLWGLLHARGRVPLWLAASVIGLVSLSRLYLGAHYLGDVLGGAVLGTFLVWGFMRSWPPVERWLAERSPTWFSVAAVVGVAGAAAIPLLRSSSPFLWNAAAVGAAAVIGLLLEYRHVRYVPPGVLSARRRAAVVGIGLAGILPFVLVDRLTGDEPLWVGAAAVSLATLWALLGAPVLYSLTLSAVRERGEESPGRPHPGIAPAGRRPGPRPGDESWTG
jgi:membrane-associated phospholipid phosphatase